MRCLGYLSRSYKRYTERELAEAYQKGVGALLVFETPVDLTDVHEQLKEKDIRIRNLERAMQEMKAQIIELRLEKIEEANGIKKK